MKHKTASQPSLVSELGAIAGLYRTVIWMFGQRLQHGPEWHERLNDDTFRLPSAQQIGETHDAAHRN